MQVHGNRALSLALGRRKGEGICIFWSGGAGILLASWVVLWKYFDRSGLEDAEKTYHAIQRKNDMSIPGDIVPEAIKDVRNMPIDSKNVGIIHSDGVFLVTLQLYFPNESDTEDYYVMYNWKKSDNYTKMRIEYEKRVLNSTANNKINYFTKQPKIGFGTAQDMHIRAKNVSTYIKSSFFTGFRHIDTSNYYRTEMSVGEGIKYSGLERNEIFVTAKYMPDRKICEMDYDSTIKAFNKTISQLGIEYVDLYLVHIPGFTDAQLRKCKSNVQLFDSKITNKIRRREVWRAMETLYYEGRVHALGVSNFSPEHLDNILEAARIWPVMNQVQFNPFYHNEDWWTHNMANGVLLTSFSSARFFLNEGPSSPRMKIFEELSQKYNRTPLQVFLRWIIERKVNILTSSTSQKHQRENLGILDFQLDKVDILRISGLAQDEEQGLHMRVS
ncbi:unnamed protein product [Bathycoccus prasinos]